MLYRVTYGSDSIYEAYRNAVSNKELNEFCKKFKWMNPRFVHEHSDWRLYFTERGYIEFRESILPEITKVLDKDKIEVEQVSENPYPADQIAYEDEYQRVYDIQGSNILSEEYLQTLQEVYFGKSITLQQAENLLDNMRKEYMSGSPRIPKNDPNLLQFNALIMQFFGLGGFMLKVSLDPVPAISSIPMTYNRKIKFTDSYIVDPDSYRFKKEAGYTCIINVTTGMIFSDHFTTEEIMAAILYELGYMFFGCFSNSNAILANVKSATNLATAIASIVQQMFYVEKIGKWVEDMILSKKLVNSPFQEMTPEQAENFRGIIANWTPEFYAQWEKKWLEERNTKVKQFVKGYANKFTAGLRGVTLGMIVSNSRLVNMFKDTFKNDYAQNNGIRSVAVTFVNYVKIAINYIMAGVNSMTMRALRMVGSTGLGGSILHTLGVYDMIVPYRSAIETAKNPMNWISMPINYKASLAAGNFPTMYGYGAAEISYFQKMQSNNKIGLVKHFLKTCPWMGVVFDVAVLPARILNGVFDQSPNGVARCMDQIKMLEVELAKQSLTPELRSRISQDIADCKQALSKLTDISNGVRDPDILQKIYNKVLVDCLGSVGLKDAMFNNTSRFEEWDKETNAKKDI